MVYRRNIENTQNNVFYFVSILFIYIGFKLFNESQYIYIPNGSYQIFNKTNCNNVEIMCYDSSNIKIISRTNEPEYELKYIIRKRSFSIDKTNYFIERRYMKKGYLFNYSIETTHPVFLHYFSNTKYNKHLKESIYIVNSFNGTWKIPKDDYYNIIIEKYNSHVMDYSPPHLVMFNFSIEVKMIKYEDSHDCIRLPIIVPIKENDVYIVNKDFEKDKGNKVWWKCH